AGPDLDQRRPGGRGPGPGPVAGGSQGAGQAEEGQEGEVTWQTNRHEPSRTRGRVWVASSGSSRPGATPAIAPPPAGSVATAPAPASRSATWTARSRPPGSATGACSPRRPAPRASTSRGP